MDMLLKLYANKGMVIDMPIRWGSTACMIKRALELKESIKKIKGKETHLTDFEWEELERLNQILQIPHKATIALQKENLTPGECLLEWREVTFRLDKIQGTIASGIAKALKEREKKLMENDIFLAAVWIDSRARILLTENEKSRAKRNLFSLYRRIESPESTQPQSAQENTATGVSIF